jgi:hypothetical protein
MIVTPDDARNYDKVLKLTKKEPETVVLDVDWSAIETGGDRGRRPGRDGRSDRGDRSRGRAPREAVHRDDEAPADVEPSAPRAPSRTRKEPVAPRIADSDEAQPYVDAGDWGVGASQPREPRRPNRAPPVGGGRAESVRRDDSQRSRREESGHDSTVVGFGAETPAFLLRAAPIAQLRKTAAAED